MNWQDNGYWWYWTWPLSPQPTYTITTTPILACDHCRCIAVEPQGERTRLHEKCCKCGDVKVAPPGSTVGGCAR